jgi:hypothetical protein
MPCADRFTADRSTSRPRIVMVAAASRIAREDAPLALTPTAPAPLNLLAAPTCPPVDAAVVLRRAQIPIADAHPHQETGTRHQEAATATEPDRDPHLLLGGKIFQEMTCSEGTRKESPEGTPEVTESSVMTGHTAMRGISGMIGDTMLHARLRATAREKGPHCLSSAYVSLLRLVVEDVGHLHQRSGRDWRARLQEEDTMTSHLPVLVARHVVDSLPVGSARPWLVV